MQKKYYCPYCGCRSLRVGQKINIGATFTASHKSCSNCGEIVSLKDNGIRIIVFVFMLLFLLVSIIFKSFVFFLLFIVLYVLYDVVSVLFSKFVKNKKLDNNLKEYIYDVEFSPYIKFPKVYFSGNSVLEIECCGARYPVNIMLKSLDQIRFSFVDFEKKMEFTEKIITFYDGDKIIGKGKIV